MIIIVSFHYSVIIVMFEKFIILSLVTSTEFTSNEIMMKLKAEQAVSVNCSANLHGKLLTHR